MFSPLLPQVNERDSTYKKKQKNYDNDSLFQKKLSFFCPFSLQPKQLQTDYVSSHYISFTLALHSFFIF